MGKRLLLCFLTCLPYISLMAQNPMKWYEGIGVRVGANVSSVRDASMLNELKSGYIIGVNYNLKLINNFGVTSGLYFTTKGGLDNQEAQNITARLKLSYIQIPAMINYNFELGDFHISPAIGGYYSYCTGGVASASDGSSASWLNSDNPMQKILRHSDVGIRLNCDFGWKHIVLGLGYDLGLFNIAEKYIEYDQYTRVPLNYSWKTNSLFLTIGWNF